VVQCATCALSRRTSTPLPARHLRRSLGAGVSHRAEVIDIEADGYRLKHPNELSGAQ
jgi:hypothetical protein